MVKLYDILKYKQTIKVLTLLLVMCFGKSWGQATLPLTRTAWGTTPTGWTDNGVNRTTTFACSGSNGGSLQSSGKYYLVFFNSAPDLLSYSIKGSNNTTGADFRVEESVNGTTWTSVVTYSVISGSSCIAESKTLLCTSRYVRFIFVTKGTGNVDIDDVTISSFTGSCGAPNTITTGIVNNPPFSLPSCTATASGTVAFTSTGTFNTGNNYTAQLSDASGSFASPISIGSISSVSNSGTVSITIPAGTASGTGYMIRIVSDNPIITGSNSAVFTITTTCTPTITPGGTITACAFSGAMSIYDKCNNGQGCTSGCNLSAYSNLGYTMCNGSTFNGNCPSGEQLQGIVFNIPSGCTMSVTVEFKTRGGACSNSGMDGGDYLKINGTTYTGSSNADVTQSITQTGGSIFIEQSADRSEEILTFTASIVSGSCVQCSLLDVTLLNFSCVTESEGYKLIWATANEHNSQNFEIEYSIDGIHFNKIAEVQAKGESNSYLQYEKYIENVFSSPFVYFRLKMNNFSGSYTYSPIVYVQNDFFSSITISPNPSLNDNVVVYVGKKIDYLNSIISVFDLSGKQLVEQLITESQTVVNTQNFAEGIYFLRISTPYKTENYKLIIQK